MSTVTTARQTRFTGNHTAAAPPAWAGDPTILVYATRYALARHGQHVAEFVRQALTCNARRLPPTAKATIIRDVRRWLADERNENSADWAVWVATLEALGVHHAETTGVAR